MASAPPQDELRRAAERLVAEQTRILDLHMERVRSEIRAARHEARPILVDTLPAFLRNLADALDPDSPRHLATEGSSIAAEHGGERARLTRWRPDDVVREYQFLRDILLEVLGEGGRPPEPVAAVIVKSIDTAVAEACTAYFLVSNRMREQFTAALSHDLRNPLAAIRASATLILRRTDKSDVIRWGSRIVENVDRADEMIRDMLDASQLEAGERLPLQVSHFDLARVVHDAAAHLTALHGEHFVVVTPECVMAHGAPNELRRAIENLGTNAIKYGAQGQPISISLKVAHDRALISVHNEGSYIAVEEQERLFQAFRRAKAPASSQKPGWGIGLSIVRGVAEGHGGSVGIDSRPETGTTFIIDVPLDARPYQPAPPSA